MTKLSILVCHLPEREQFLDGLTKILQPQLSRSVEVIIEYGHGTIGEKRNRLLQKATGQYLAFIDDDDRVSKDYVSLIMAGIDRGVDCCSLTGEITFDGLNPKKFIHSRKYVTYFEENQIYYRPPNHLNCIKSSIAKNFSFTHKNHGEDTDWAMQISRARAIKTEHTIPNTIYYYDYRSKK